MPKTRFGKKKDNTSEVEVALELASGLSSDERGDRDMVEYQLVYFVDYYANDEYGVHLRAPHQIIGQVE